MVWVLLLPPCIGIALSDSIIPVAIYDVGSLIIFIVFVTITILYGTKLALIIGSNEKLINLRLFLRRVRFYINM